MIPLMRAAMFAVCGETKWPVYSSQSVTLRCNGFVTDTVAGGGACMAGWRLHPVK
jgi:hypothetical protein